MDVQKHNYQQTWERGVLRGNQNNKFLLIKQPLFANEQFWP